MRIINESIKKIKKNYYNPRSKKVLNLIKNLIVKILKQQLGRMYIFYLKDQICA